MTNTEWTDLKKYYKFGLAERRALLPYEFEDQAARIRSDRGLSDFRKLVAEIDLLRAALHRYGNHDPSCDYPRGNCDCGFRQASGSI